MTTAGSWKPIRRFGAPLVEVTVPGRRSVTVELSGVAPEGWAEGFNNPPSVTFSTLMDAAPRLTGMGDAVEFDCRDEAFDAYMKSIDERIAGGNLRYQQQVLPALARAGAEEEAAGDARAAAQAKADEDAKRWDAGEANDDDNHEMPGF